MPPPQMAKVREGEMIMCENLIQPEAYNEHSSHIVKRRGGKEGGKEKREGEGGRESQKLVLFPGKETKQMRLPFCLEQ